MKKIILNADDIIVTDIITKHDYIQNRIKYDSKYFVKEVYNKYFLIPLEQKSKILFSNYLFTIKNDLNLKEGVVIIADFRENKDVFLLGTLDNPLDTHSLLKIEFKKDSYYEKNILSFSNWVKFFSSFNKSSFVITNNQQEFNTLIGTLELNNYSFNFFDDISISSINSKLKPVFTKEDLLVMYVPVIFLFLFLFLLINNVGDSIIKNDIENSSLKRQESSKNLASLTNELQKIKNDEYFKNRDYYLKLSDRKVYKKGEQND